MSLLFTVTGLVLLIACANIANLLMARAADRAAEIGIRMSLGASAAGLVRVLLVKSTILGVLGAAAGLAVARATFVGLSGMMPSADAGPLQFEMNGAILAFTILLGVGCGLVSASCPRFTRCVDGDRTSPAPNGHPDHAARPASGPRSRRCRSRWRPPCSQPRPC